MIVILGLIILIAAVVLGAAGVFGNGGGAHALTNGFSVFGYHVTGSTGTLFLYGVVVGAVAMFGLSLLLAGARRTARRGSAARRGLQESRRETAAASQAREDPTNQRATAHAYTAGAPGNGTPRGHRDLNPDDGPRSRLRLPGRRSAPPQTAATDPEPLTGKPAPEVPADPPARAE
jgi:hypothetical protein